MKKTLKSFQQYQITNLYHIKGGKQSNGSATHQNSQDASSKKDDAVTEEIVFVVEDMQIA
ncbi:hypothetical protein BKI52_35700 [marine bacterium AO1-C]|nr:hypothetical protein BKI52_35700 [marine bacterium AO1-C]